jgi:hypothetical protein
LDVKQFAFMIRRITVVLEIKEELLGMEKKQLPPRRAGAEELWRVAADHGHSDG